MNKTLQLSFLAAAVLQAAEPMVPTSMSTDRGGVKSAIDAYSDGGGVYLYDEKGRQVYDNSPMNKLVFKYGEEAKKSGVALKDQIKTLSQATAEEKLLADKISVSSVAIEPPVDGTGCNDNNAQTIDDKYISGICAGTNVEGQGCNDNNAQTINDKYTSGVCAGTIAEGQVCDDNNIQTINDKYVSGVCVGTNVEGQSCNDNNIQTINDKYVSGVCVGTNVEGQSCNDGYSSTSSDAYHNGVCAGTIAGCQSITSGSCTSCSTGYTLSNGICLQNITVSGGKWSDGTTSPTCWEYYTGKTTSTKKYIASTSSGTYTLTDGRNPSCNMPALASVHNSFNWTSLFTLDTANCYVNQMSSISSVFPHPVNTSYCTATLNTGGMFKSITLYVKQSATDGDGIGWKISGTGVSTQSGTLSPNTQTSNITVSPSGTLYLQTNSPSGNNSYDWVDFIITGYTE